MGTVIYSASPLGTFSGTLLQMGFLIGLGIVGLGWAIFNGNQRKGPRIAVGVAGLFLCGIGVLMLGYTLLNMMTTAQTATVSLHNKRVVTDNCGDNGQTCTRYVLETTAMPRSYDFTVGRSVFDSVEPGACYRVTYYPNKGLFATDYGSDLYVATAYISRIEQMQASDCN